MSESQLKYVLVTPARNKEAFLELTIQSVVNQKVRPAKWVIVSDGSTDRTDEIASKYVQEHEWIEFLRMPDRTERDFAGKVGCFNAGYARLKEVQYDIVGSLDADISFEPDYFEFLLDKFANDASLGLAGTPFDEGGDVYDYRFSSTDHVSGACQLFRRECFEEIGGYVPLKGGGIDVVAVLSARQKGWRTQTFIEKKCRHHRPMGSANHKGKIVAAYKLGRRAYCVGFHPLWQVFRSVYQMTRRPYVVSGCALFIGYFCALVSRAPMSMTQELARFQRKDQMRRLRSFFATRLGWRRKESVVVSSK